MDKVQQSETFTRDSLLFTTNAPRSYWFSLDWPWNDERLSWSLSHPVVLNMVPLDRESSALAARILLLIYCFFNLVSWFFGIGQSVLIGNQKHVYFNVHLMGKQHLFGKISGNLKMSHFWIPCVINFRSGGVIFMWLTDESSVL